MSEYMKTQIAESVPVSAKELNLTKQFNLQFISNWYCCLPLYRCMIHIIPTFYLPQVPEGKQRWLKVTHQTQKNTVFYEHHWPAEYRKLKFEIKNVTTDCF